MQTAILILLGCGVSASTVDFDSTRLGSNPSIPASVNGLNALMVGQQAVTLWLRQVGSIPTQPTNGL